MLSAIVIGTWNWLAAKRDDAVRLKATISQPGDLEIMKRIGCACMIVTIKSDGKRIAKISGATVALEGIDLIPQFEKAFGDDFGYVPVDVGRPPAFAIDLVPLRKTDCSEGFILERDDVVRFAMPIRVPILDRFPKAPSQNVQIAVKFFDGAEQVVLRGMAIQNVIADLIEDWGKKAQTLNVNLTFGLRGNSRIRPANNAELMGKLNPNPLIFFPDDTPQDVKDRLEGKAGTTAMRMPVYSLVRADDSKAVMLTTSDGLLLPIFSTLQIATTVKGQATIQVNIIELRTSDDLWAFVQNPPGRPTDGPEFNVLLDSVDPHYRKQGLVMRSEFLGSLRNQKQGLEGGESTSPAGGPGS